MSAQVAQLTLLINQKSESQSTSILSQLEDFGAKTKKQKWGDDSPELKSITTEELKGKIQGYNEKLAKLKGKAEEIIDSQKEQYTSLLKEVETFIERLNKTLSEKETSPKPSPAPPPPPKFDRWKRFYAEHKPEGASAAPAADTSSTIKLTWLDLKNPTDKMLEIKVLVAINMNSQDIDTDQKIANFAAEAGARVICPTSGHEYSLSFKDEIPKAILEEKNAKRDAGESDDEYLQRKAATIINMIDNVLAKSKEINISTPDPFIAKIAEAYIEYLQKDCGLKINVKSKPVVESPREGDDKKATNVFDTLKQGMKPEAIKDTQWYKDALEHREAAEKEILHGSSNPTW